MAIWGLIITGTCGFIGMNTLLKLIPNNNYDFVISIDKMGYATEFNKKIYRTLCKESNIFNVECDINNYIKLNEKAHLTNGGWTDLDILDFASESHVDNSIKDPFTIYKQNASIPGNLLTSIGKDNWDTIRTYFHISTDEIYGEIPLDKVNDQKNWFKTDTPMNPNNPYSASKAAQDCLLMSLKHTFKLPVKFIRMANQMPGMFQHPEKMLPASILRVLKGETIKIYGKGENVRQWTPVDITSEIIKDILYGNIKCDDVIHIANRKGIYTNNQIVDKLIKIMSDMGYDAKKEYIEDRKGHDTAYALDTTSKIDEYFEDVDFDNYLKQTVEYYIKNKKLFLKEI